MGLPPKPRLASCLNPKGVRTPKRSSRRSRPLLRQPETKILALNMALAALVLAASFATICYADYRADIDDVRNRLMAAHEPLPARTAAHPRRRAFPSGRGLPGRRRERRRRRWHGR